MSDTLVVCADVKFEGQPLTQFAPATLDEVVLCYVPQFSM